MKWQAPEGMQFWGQINKGDYPTYAAELGMVGKIKYMCLLVDENQKLYVGGTRKEEPYRIIVTVPW